MGSPGFRAGWAAACLGFRRWAAVAVTPAAAQPRRFCQRLCRSAARRVAGLWAAVEYRVQTKPARNAVTRAAPVFVCVISALFRPTAKSARSLFKCHGGAAGPRVQPPVRRWKKRPLRPLLRRCKWLMLWPNPRPRLLHPRRLKNPPCAMAVCRPHSYSAAIYDGNAAAKL